MNVPLLMLCCAAALTASIFLLWLVSVKIEDVSIVDIFWGCAYVIVAAIGCIWGGGPAWRRYLLLAMVGLWGLRLSGYLAWRNLGSGEDKRYVAMRQRFGKRFWWQSLYIVFGLQGLLALIISLPIVAACAAIAPSTTGQLSTPGLLSALGIALWFVGLACETTADFQLARFKAAPSNRGKVNDRGLWRYSRHPNYFGDAVVWWGLYIYCAEAHGAWWTIISPLLMTTLLLKVSGVALLEKTIVKRRPAYRDYIERTSAFIPWPPKTASRD